MSIVSNNIKYLRKKLGLTQEQMAEQIGIKRSLLGAYEEGRADPRLNNLMSMAKIFGVSVDVLIGKDVSNLSSEDLSTAYQPVNNGNGALKVLSITVDHQGKENIELVQQKAAAGYMNGYSDPEYLEDLTRFSLPILPANATYRAFEITGDSMLPLVSGTIVIGRYVENISDVKNGKTYIIVSSKEGIVYKRVFNYVRDNGKLFLASDNKTYAPYELPVEEVLEVWEAKAFISLQFPDPETKEDMSLEKLTSIVLDLQQEVIKLKNH
jgi:transcriptional regulator with XRE-family HTH domain